MTFPDRKLLLVLVVGCGARVGDSKRQSIPYEQLRDYPSTIFGSLEVKVSKFKEALQSGQPLFL